MNDKQKTFLSRFILLFILIVDTLLFLVVALLELTLVEAVVIAVIVLAFTALLIWCCNHL